MVGRNGGPEVWGGSVSNPVLAAGAMCASGGWSRRLICM